MSEDTFSEETLEKKMQTIRGLISRADHPSTPPGEAQSCREKADALMFKYRIEEATLVQQQSGLVGNSENGLVPVWRMMTVSSMTSEFAMSYRNIANAVARHCSLRGMFTYSEGDCVLKACGYTSDLMYAEVLLTSAMLEFGRLLEPKVDPNLTPQQNALIMRQAGMERKRIALLLLGKWDTENEMKAKNRMITKWVKAEAARQGFNAEEILGRGNDMKVYRESYAAGFVSTLQSRLWGMRHMQGVESGAIVLADRSERVNRKFYEEYPHLDPEYIKKQQEENPYVAENADCARCQNAKSGYCREHSYLRPLKGRASYGRSNFAAYDRGSDAARRIDLGRNSQGTHKAGTSDRKEIG